MADEIVDAAETGEETLSEFDPSKLPLGTFAAFNVSDQPMWTTIPGESQIEDQYQKAIKAMVSAAAIADNVARRIEIQGAWMLELLDRGFHNIKPQSDGWNISGLPGTGRYQNLGPYGSCLANGSHPTNVIGEKNDIIVACLTRELAESKFVPECPGDPDDEVYADTADSMRNFIADENKYGKRQAEVARFFCTDETAVSYVRPVADAQRWGYEDAEESVVPESQDLPPEPKATSKRPKMRVCMDVYGKLSRKVPMMARDQSAMQFQMLAWESDIAQAKSTYTWVADKITAGDLGIAEIKLDRLARQSIRLAVQAYYGTGDSLARDVTETYVWFRPGFYMDDSCPKPCRAWFWENFPKGMLCVYASDVLCYVRNEGMDEVLNIFHAHTGNGQNRRALTESYAGPQLRLNTLVDLWDEFCRKEVPRVGADKDVWNVPALRASSVRVASIEPCIAPVGRPLADTLVAFPQPSHVPTMPDFIMWLSGPLAEQLTHATQSLSGSQDANDPDQTATESKLKDHSSMTAFGESWKEICEGFAVADTQGVSWVARVLPETEKFDSDFPGKGRIQAEVGKLKMGAGKARANGEASFPQSWAEREQAWDKVMAAAEANPQGVAAGIVGNPITLAGMKPFLPKGMVIPGVAAVEKQQGEFDVLLRTAPVDNPQFIQAQQMVAQLTPLVQMGTEEMQQMQAQGIPPDPQKAQLLQQAQQQLQQAQQALQTMQPQISSVPVRPTDNDAVEMQVCDEMINGAVGRRLGSSKVPEDMAAYANLVMHFNQHEAQAKQKAMQNVKPTPAKVSINIDPSKLDPSAEAGALALAGVPSNPAEANQGGMHEYTTTEKGVGPSGSEIERTVSVTGKPLQ